MRYILNEIGHYDFFEQLDRFKIDIDLMLASEAFNSKEKADTIINTVKGYIIKYISPSSEEILNLLSDHYSSIDDYYFEDLGINEKPKKEKNRLSRFGRSIEKLRNYLSVVDSLIDPNASVKVETVTDKNDYLLLKLNTLFGDEMYSASLLFELNDIKLRSKEGREIAENLQKRGYVVLRDQYGDSDIVNISVKGAAYIERKNKVRNRASDSELNKRIDNIIEHLVNLGYGQEIIFNEIEELRELQHKLSKKSWKQLLKGKLIDLTLDKLINVDTASSIFEYLTNGSLKLIK